MQVVEVVLDDVLNGLGEAFENVQVLGQREPLDDQRIPKEFQLALEFRRPDAIQPQGLVEQLEGFVDLGKRGLGDQAEIDLLDQTLEQHVHHRLQSQGEPQAVEFHLVVAAVHGGDVDGNVPFLVDVLADLVDGFRRNDGLQLFEIAQDESKPPLRVGLSQRLFQAAQLRQRLGTQLRQVVLQFHDVEPVFLMQQ